MKERQWSAPPTPADAAPRSGGRAPVAPAGISPAVMRLAGGGVSQPSLVPDVDAPHSSAPPPAPRREAAGLIDGRDLAARSGVSQPFLSQIRRTARRRRLSPRVAAVVPSGVGHGGKGRPAGRQHHVEGQGGDDHARGERRDQPAGGAHQVPAHGRPATRQEQLPRRRGLEHPDDEQRGRRCAPRSAAWSPSTRAAK